MTKLQKSELYKKVEVFIDNSFSEYRNTPKHMKNTVECLLEIDPYANEELKIAALSHDIERGFRKSDMTDIINNAKDSFKNELFLKNHQERGAEIIADFLKKNKVNDGFIEKVRSLVSVHEIGGDDDQNLLKDADSLSFFRGENFKSIMKKHPEIPLRPKVEWMYERITSDKAKELTKPLYEKAIKELKRFKWKLLN